MSILLKYNNITKIKFESNKQKQNSHHHHLDGQNQMRNEPWETLKGKATVLAGKQGIGDLMVWEKLKDLYESDWFTIPHVHPDISLLAQSIADHHMPPHMKTTAGPCLAELDLNI